MTHENASSRNRLGQGRPVRRCRQIGSAQSSPWRREQSAPTWMGAIRLGQQGWTGQRESGGGYVVNLEWCGQPEAARYKASRAARDGARHGQGEARGHVFDLGTEPAGGRKRARYGDGCGHVMVRGRRRCILRDSQARPRRIQVVSQRAIRKCLGRSKDGPRWVRARPTGVITCNLNMQKHDY